MTLFYFRVSLPTTVIYDYSEIVKVLLNKFNITSIKKKDFDFGEITVDTVNNMIIYDVVYKIDYKAQA